MTTSALDLSTAVFPTGAGMLDGDAIVSSTPGDEVGFVIPDITLQPERWYQFEFDFGSYDASATDMDVEIFASNGTGIIAGTSLGGTWDYGSDQTGAPSTRIFTIGPGLENWDGAVVASGLTTPWFFQAADLRLEAARFRVGTLSGWSDWYDDANTTWLVHNVSPEPTNDIHQQVSRDTIAANPGAGIPAGDFNEVWNGTGHYSAVTNPELSDGNSDKAQGALGDNGGGLFEWAQRWWTRGRGTDTLTATTGTYPDYWESNPPVEVEWEPTSEVVDHRLMVEAEAAHAGSFAVKGLYVPGTAGYNPGAFLPRTSVLSQATLDVRAYTESPDFTSLPGLNSQFFPIGGSALSAIGVAMTGATQVALTLVDEWTLNGSYPGPPAYNQAFIRSADFESGYRPRYRVRTFIEGSGAPAPLRLHPRSDQLGVGCGRIWPRPGTQQASNRRAGTHF